MLCSEVHHEEAGDEPAVLQPDEKLHFTEPLLWLVTNNLGHIHRTNQAFSCNASAINLA